MGQFSTCDFVGTRTSFQRFSDSKLFHGWVQGFTLANLVVRTTTDHLLKKGDRFIFHVVAKHTNARFVAEFSAVDGLELIRSMTLPMGNQGTANLVEVPEANYSFKLVSQLEYQPATEEARHMVGGWVVEVRNSEGDRQNAFISDVSDTGAGILSALPYKRGEIVTVKIEGLGRGLELDGEVRYSVRSKIAPDMYKTGLKFNEFGRLEGAVWRNFLRAA